MNDWQIIVLTAGCSLLASVITGFLTSFISHRNEIKNKILEKRTGLYFDFYDVIEKITVHPMDVYSDDFVNEILKYKPSMKLLASDKTTKAFKNLYEFIIEKYQLSKDYIAKNDPIETMTESCYNEDGEEYEICHAQQWDIDAFESSLLKYEEDNLDSEQMKELIKSLYTNMRHDLGNNIR